MNVSELERKLIAAARTQAPADTVPYAFEQRVLARLKKVPRLDQWAAWSSALWKAAGPCVLVALLLSAWTLFGSERRATPADLSQQLENTLLVSVTQETVVPDTTTAR